MFLQIRGEQNHRATTIGNSSLHLQSVVPLQLPKHRATLAYRPKRCSSIVHTSTSAVAWSSCTFSTTKGSFFSTVAVRWGQLLHAQDAVSAVCTSCLVNTPTPAVAILDELIIHSSSRPLCARSTVHHQGHFLVVLATVGLVAHHSAVAHPLDSDAGSLKSESGRESVIPPNQLVYPIAAVARHICHFFSRSASG